MIRTEMEKNFFYVHRREIAKISKKENVDAGVATSMFANQHRSEYTVGEMNEWMDIMSAYQQHKTLTLADLFK